MEDIELLKKKVNDFSILLNITKSLNSEKNLTQLLGFFIEEITKIMDAERSTIYILDRSDNVLVSFIAQDVEIKEIRLQIGEGIAGKVAESGEILNIPDAYQDPRFNKELDKQTGFITSSILTIPMKNNEGKITGVIQVLNKKNGVFTNYDEDLLMTIGSQAAIAIENATLYEENDKLLKSTIKTLAAAIDARDPVTSGHSERVTYFSMKVGIFLKLDEKKLKILEYASWLHDVGKIGISDEILLKAGKYSDEERKMIETHTQHTREILNKIYFPYDLTTVPTIATHHHERLDGSGYPDGIKDDQIDILERIIAVTDVYDALTAYDRPYKKAMPVKAALEVLKEEGEKNRLDKDIIDVFINNKLYFYERRQYVRINSEIEIEYKMITEEELFEKNPDLSKTINIAAGGLLFKTKQFIPLDTYMEVDIKILELKIATIAKVIRLEKELISGNYLIGINFINLPEKLKEKIQKFLTEKIELNKFQKN